MAASETMWCAQWMSGFEFIAWREIKSGGRQLGGLGHEVSAKLKQAAEDARGWVRWDREADGLVFVPMDEWLELYAAWEAEAARW